MYKNVTSTREVKIMLSSYPWKYYMSINTDDGVSEENITTYIEDDSDDSFTYDEDGAFIERPVCKTHRHKLSPYLAAVPELIEMVQRLVNSDNNLKGIEVLRSEAKVLLEKLENEEKDAEEHYFKALEFQRLIKKDKHCRWRDDCMTPKEEKRLDELRRFFKESKHCDL